MDDQMDFDRIMRIILKTSAFIFVLGFISKFLGYVFNIILVKSLPAEIYGIYTLAWAVVTSMSVILLLGIPNAVYRFIAFYRGEKNSENVGATIKTGSIILAILMAISLFILSLLFTIFPQFFSFSMEESILVGILFVTNSLFVFSTYIISGFRKPHLSELVQFSGQLLKVVFVFFVILMGISLLNVLIALYLAFLIPTLAAVLYVIKKFGISGKFDTKLGKDLIRFGIPVTITGTSSTLLAWADMFMIRIFSGFSDLGIYYVANLTATVTFIFFYPVIEIFSPMITEFFGEKNRKKVGYISSYLFETMFILVLPLFILFIMFPSEILIIFFKEEYASGAVAFQLMSVSMLLYGISQLFARILSASGNPQKEARIVVSAAGVNILLNLILIPQFGISGAAFATVISSMIILISSYIYARGIVDMKISGNRLYRLMLSALMGFFIVFLVKEFIPDMFLSLALSILFLMPVYIVALILLKTFRSEDIMLLKAIMIKLNLQEGIRNKILDIFRKGIR